MSGKSEEEQEIISDEETFGTPSIRTNSSSSTSDTPVLISRLQMDYDEALESGKEQGYTVELVDNDLELWSVKFHKFDGLPIYEDMKKYEEKYHRNYIELLITFPSNYPSIAPFFRVYRPRFVQYTGHVTIGGSICSASLTFKAWTPVRTISSLISEMFALIMTGDADDPPPKLDLSSDEPYDLPEAIKAYRRMAEKYGMMIPNWTPKK